MAFGKRSDGTAVGWQRPSLPGVLRLLGGQGEAEQYRWDSTHQENEPWRHMPSKGSSQKGRRVTAEKVLAGNCGAGSFSLSRVRGKGLGRKGDPSFFVTPVEGSSPQKLEVTRRMDFTLFSQSPLFKKKKKAGHRDQLPLKLSK